MQTPRFFSPFANTSILQNRLPHWEQSRAAYFVSFRLADSISAHLRKQWTSERNFWLKQNPPPLSESKKQEYHLLFSTTLESWLDAGTGCCALRNSKAATIVAETLLHFENTRINQFAFVVMPNHVHALFAMLDATPLNELIKSWKTFSSKRLKSLLGDNWSGRQKDYHDRLVRNENHFASCLRYIHENPQKARLSPKEYVLFESSLN